MSRWNSSSVISVSRFPRVSGDEPAIPPMVDVLTMFSPREWG